PPSAGRCRALRSERSRSGRASIHSCRARTVGAWRLSQRLYRFEHRERVAVDLQLAPFVAQDAAGIEQECAALDADHLAAIHFLLADDVEQRARQTVGVRQQRKRAAHLRPEFLMRRDAVARDTDNIRTSALEARRQRGKLLALEGAARS